MWINGLEIAAVLTLVEERIRFASAEMKSRIACKPLYLFPISSLAEEPHNDFGGEQSVGIGLLYCCRVLEIKDIVLDRFT